MDNKELDSILKNKFQSLQRPEGEVNLVSDIMAQVATLPQVDPESSAVRSAIGLNWILLFAVLFGGGIFALSLQSLPLERLAELVPVTLLGDYTSVVAALIVPLVAVAGLMPVAWLMLED